jgi:hypothetical protein
MVTIYKTDNIKNTGDGQTIFAELRGLSTDTKPTQIGNKAIGNGSVFVEIDTGNIFFYDLDSETWKEA